MHLCMDVNKTVPYFYVLQAIHALINIELHLFTTTTNNYITHPTLVLSCYRLIQQLHNSRWLSRQQNASHS